MRWPWRRHRVEGNGHEAAKAKAEAQAEFRRTKSFTRHVEDMARDVADLPADEFVERVSKAFRRRPA